MMEEVRGRFGGCFDGCRERGIERIGSAFVVEVWTGPAMEAMI